MALYQPDPVPFEVDQIPAYLERELKKLEELAATLAQKAYGGMVSEDDNPILVDVTPIPLDIFSTITPIATYIDGVEVQLSPPELIPLTGGVFLGCFVATVGEIPTQIEVNIEFRLDNQPTRTITVDPSNQTDQTTVTFSSLVLLEKGQELSAWVYADGPATVEFRDASFFLSRISDTFD